MILYFEQNCHIIERFLPLHLLPIFDISCEICFLMFTIGFAIIHKVLIAIYPLCFNKLELCFCLSRSSSCLGFAEPVSPFKDQPSNEFSYVQLQDLEVVTTLGMGGFGRVELVSIYIHSY